MNWLMLIHLCQSGSLSWSHRHQRIVEHGMRRGDWSVKATALEREVKNRQSGHVNACQRRAFQQANLERDTEMAERGVSKRKRGEH
jgi:hypothetical protein